MLRSSTSSFNHASLILKLIEIPGSFPTLRNKILRETPRQRSILNPSPNIHDWITSIIYMAVQLLCIHQQPQ